MRGKFLLVAALWFNLPAQAVLVISDIDDTLKITNLNNYIEAGKNMLWGYDYFPGLPEVLDRMSQNGRLHFVSAAPEFSRLNVQRLLEITGLYHSTYTLTGGVHRKVSTIRQALQLTTDDVILVGDDGQDDPHIYHSIQRQFGNRIKAVYLHYIDGTALYTGQDRFYTAYDIALLEFARGRLTEDELQEIGMAVLNGRLEHVQPKFKKCPPPDYYLSAVTDLDRIIRRRIYQICLLR